MKKSIRDLKKTSSNLFLLITQQPILFIPLFIWIIAIYYTYKFAASFYNLESSNFDLIHFIFNYSKVYLVFNLLFSTIVIIINLWVLNIIKLNSVNNFQTFYKAFLKSIGLKFIILFPFIFIWMFFQIIFLSLFSLILIFMGATRSQDDGSIINKLLSSLFTISLTLVFFLYLCTPGMVFEEINIFSSIKRMSKHLYKNFWIVYDNLKSYAYFFLIVFIIIGTPLWLFEKQLNNDSVELVMYVMAFFLILIFYLAQIKIGHFYLWAMRQDTIKHN